MAEGTTPPAGEEDLVHALKLAGRHFQAGRLREAKTLYEGILSRHPGSAAALHFLGLIAHSEGESERAVDLLEQAIARGATVPIFHGNLGEVYRALGRNADAAAACRKALELYPVYPEALNTLGAALFELGELEEAAGSLRKAIDFKPDFAEAHANLGNILHARGDAEKAVEAYRQALQHSPRLVEVYAALGKALQGLGRWDEAVAGYRRGLQAAPNHPVLWSSLGIALAETNRLDEALAAFERAVRLKPDYADAYVNMGHALRKSGRVEDALKAYQRAVDARPDFAAAHSSRGFALERIHRLDEARSAAMAALEIAPDHDWSRLLLARLDRRGGAPEKARVLLETLLRERLEPGVRARAEVELGHTLDGLGDYPAAFAAFERGQAEFAQDKASSVDGQSLDDMIERNLRGFTKNRVAEWHRAPFGDGIPSPIFLVGFPRSGTTLVEQILGAYSDVKTSAEAPITTTTLRNFASIVGRPAAGPDDPGDLSISELRKLRAFYWEAAAGLLGTDVRSCRFVDKLPLNIVHLGVLHRIFPDAKVLVALRDPRDVCLSCFFQAFAPNEGMVHFLSLKDTARLYEAVMRLWRQYRDALDLDYLQYRYEDLVTDLEGTTGKILDFLGLEWDERITRYHDAARQRYITTPSYQGVAEPIYDRSVGRWRNYRSQLEPVLDILQPFVEEFGYA